MQQRQACGICGFQNLKQDPMIVKCREQFWEHIPGTEYLAANPHDIPGFPEILLEQYCAEYPLGDGAFTLWNDSCSSDFSKPGNLGDPFTGLPTELKNMIVSHLSSKDIASLRLTSRSFRQISRTVFRRLIREELPWFWEYDTLEEYRLECLQYENGLSQEAAATKHTQMTVNWLEIYTRLCIAKRTILGVQNRARVWDLTEEVVRRVAQLRKTREGVGFSFEHGEDLRVRPSEEEQEAGVVKKYIYCPRCRPAGT
jgi:ribosomal protein S27AE